MPIEIHVRNDDIAQGVRQDDVSCAMALATAREVGYQVSVSDYDVFYWDADGIMYFLLMPVEAQEFISDFEAGKFVQPISFIAKYDLDD